jgi:4-oxalocrotonate tautomerase
MRYVNIKLTKEDVTQRQKARIIRGVNKVLTDALGKNPQTTVVIIDEIGTDNWGIDGEALTVRRQRGYLK